MVESFPGLPEVWTWTPGIVRRTSSTARYSWTRIASSGTTLTDAPICSSGCSLRVAVTTTGSARRTSAVGLAGVAGAALGVVWAVSSAPAHPGPSHSSIASTHHVLSTRSSRTPLPRRGVGPRAARSVS